MNRLPNLKQRLEQLIATASVSSVSPEWDMGNIEVIELLAGWFKELGFTVEIQHLEQKNKANMIATLGTGTEGGLVLSGHSDTVPFNERRWKSNPLHLTERDNKFFGLGTADMKSFFALIIEAVTPLLEANFKAPLIILATADEESSMAGARALTEQSVNGAQAAIIGEPTGLKPIRMHKSIMMHKLEVIGQSGHSSNPALGKNAIDAMSDILITLRSFRDKLQATEQMKDFAVAFPTMNLGCIHGGDNPNRICNSCEMHFDFRALPGMNTDAVLHNLMQRLHPIASRHEVDLKLTELMQPVAAFAEDENAELVKIAEKISGKKAEAVAFATEAPFLKKLGLQTVIMGPGSIDQAHQPDEFISHQQLSDSVVLLRKAIEHYCIQ